MRKSDASPIPALAPGDSLQFSFHEYAVIVTVVAATLLIVVGVGVVVGVDIERILSICELEMNWQTSEIMMLRYR